MAKKTQAERIQEAADFVGDAAEEILSEVGDDTSVDDEFEIFDDADDDVDADDEIVFSEEATNAAAAAIAARRAEPQADVPITDVQQIEAASAAAAVIEAAKVADDVDAWNKVADLLYDLEHTAHEREALRASRLGRLLERLP